MVIKDNENRTVVFRESNQPLQTLLVDVLIAVLTIDVTTHAYKVAVF